MESHSPVALRNALRNVQEVRRAHSGTASCLGSRFARRLVPPWQVSRASESRLACARPQAHVSTTGTVSGVSQSPDKSPPWGEPGRATLPNPHAPSTSSCLDRKSRSSFSTQPPTQCLPMVWHASSPAGRFQPLTGDHLWPRPTLSTPPHRAWPDQHPISTSRSHCRGRLSRALREERRGLLCAPHGTAPSRPCSEHSPHSHFPLIQQASTTRRVLIIIRMSESI